MNLWGQEPLLLLAPGACAADILQPGHPQKLARLQEDADIQMLPPGGEGDCLVQISSRFQAQLHLLLCLPAALDGPVLKAWLGRC